jgi:tripartite-type tricarboxylate transporter receptor subunit TctC
VIIDNRPGGATIIGMKTVATAPPDGYTIGFSTGAALSLPATMENPGIDPVKDFTQITRVVEGSQFLVISSSLPAKNYDEFVAYAKANPGKLNFGTASGNLQHLLFNQSAGVDIAMIPYKSTTDVQLAFMGGQINVIFDNINNVNAMVAAGKARVIATQSLTRQAVLPDVPAFGEILPKASYSWSMYLFGPAGLPAPIVQKLYAAAIEAARDPEFVARVSAFGGQPVMVPPAELTRLVADEVNTWIQTARSAGVQKQ